MTKLLVGAMSTITANAAAAGTSSSSSLGYLTHAEAISLAVRFSTTLGSRLRCSDSHVLLIAGGNDGLDVVAVALRC